MTSTLIQKKICLLGAVGVGKTSLVRRFVYDVFDDSYLTTVGVKVSQKLMPPVQDSKNKWIQYNFLIWDIEGAVKHGDIQRSYLTGAAGALIVSDLTREATEETIPQLIDLFLETSPEGRVLLIGNKSDLIKPDILKDTSLDVLFPSVQTKELAFQLTSAKTGKNVERSFVDLSNLLCR